MVLSMHLSYYLYIYKKDLQVTQFYDMIQFVCVGVITNIIQFIKSPVGIAKLSYTQFLG